MKHPNTSPLYSPLSSDDDNENDYDEEEKNDEDAGEDESSSYDVKAESRSESMLPPLISNHPHHNLKFHYPSKLLRFLLLNCRGT